MGSNTTLHTSDNFQSIPSSTEMYVRIHSRPSQTRLKPASPRGIHQASEKGRQPHRNPSRAHPLRPAAATSAHEQHLGQDVTKKRTRRVCVSSHVVADDGHARAHLVRQRCDSGCFCATAADAALISVVVTLLAAAIISVFALFAGGSRASGGILCRVVVVMVTTKVVAVAR